jgi:HlyD family secretion protein
MQQLLKKRHFYTFLALVLIVSMIALVVGIFFQKAPEYVTTTAETGPVRQLVSVSGVTKAKERSDLSFGQTGVVETVLVAVGDEVEAGETLAILRNGRAESDRLAAMAALRSAIASRSELIAGPTESSRTVITQMVAVKREALETTKQVELEKVANAKRALLSDGLFAYTEDADEEAAAPEISGTYLCDTEGSYTLEFFSSNAPSGYSVKLSGIETGTYTTSIDQPLPLGTCGLRLQVDEDSRYATSLWTIDIPNKKSPSYTTNKNAYDLAVIQASSAIDLAEQEVLLAENDASDSTAKPRSEALLRADAAVEEAQARVTGYESDLNDRVLRAPFSGTITSLSIEPGEVVTNEPVLSLLTNGAFEITARVPEIDVGKLSKGQPVELLFDANREEVLTGTVSFVSLEATEIDGVAYFETYVTLPNTPPWMRSGLNADIDIIVAETSQGVRIPKRFLIEDSGAASVLILREDTTYATTTVEVLLRGNDGFVAISGLNSGDTIVAP